MTSKSTPDARPSDDDDRPVSKAEFVRLLIEIHQLSPEAYDAFCSKAWEQIAALAEIVSDKSEPPNRS